MDITLRNIKGTRGMEGAGYTASLYIDGKHVADVADWGDGGCAHFYAPKKRGQVQTMVETENLLKPARDFVAQIVAPPEVVAAWPEWHRDMYPDGREYSGHEGLECYLAGLVDAHLDERRLRARCKKGLVAVLANRERGHDTVCWNVADTPENRARLAAKQEKEGEAVREWVNDRFKGVA